MLNFKYYMYFVHSLKWDQSVGQWLDKVVSAALWKSVGQELNQINGLCNFSAWKLWFGVTVSVFVSNTAVDPIRSVKIKTIQLNFRVTWRQTSTRPTSRFPTIHQCYSEHAQVYLWRSDSHQNQWTQGCMQTRGNGLD